MELAKFVNDVSRPGTSSNNLMLQVDSNFINQTINGSMGGMLDSEYEKARLLIDEVVTRCKYQAPTLAVALGHPGVNTQTLTETFKLSNPRFHKCSGNSQGLPIRLISVFRM